eukprot:754563-Hanusia_phi.AAC.1
MGKEGGGEEGGGKEEGGKQEGGQEEGGEEEGGEEEGGGEKGGGAEKEGGNQEGGGGGKAEGEAGKQQGEGACRSASEAITELDNNQKLTPAQREAVRAALWQRCTIIQGPPGTGKTSTSVEILRLWVKAGLSRILATADGNVAVDNIAQGLASAGVKVVRIGRPEKISSLVEELTLDSQVRRRIEEKRRRVEEKKLERERRQEEYVRKYMQKLEAMPEETLVNLRSGEEGYHLDRVRLNRVYEGGTLMPRLNGTWCVIPEEERDEDITTPFLPYRKGDDPDLHCYFLVEEGKRGWYIANTEVFEIQVLAFCPQETSSPPARGWRVRRDGVEEADTGGFVEFKLTKEVCLGVLEDVRWSFAWIDVPVEKEDEEEEEEDEIGWMELEPAERQRKKERREREREMEIRDEILDDAEVICAQMITAGGDFFRHLGEFDAILVDEVAQCTEINTIVPIVQRGCTRLVLSGDHCQLPPTVQSEEAEERGMSVSLYARLVEEGLEAKFLDTQFRSHPKLMEFSSKMVYDGRLKDGVEGRERPALKGFVWPRRDVPVAFVDMGPGFYEEEQGESKMNRKEAEKLVLVLSSFLSHKGLRPRHIGIVTPYMAQVRLLRKCWNSLCAREKLDREEARELEIASVDNFQGREKDLILFSAVRSNRRGMVGFLRDWRRLNVMLTRARRGLIVFGSSHTLRHDAMWQQWLEWCEQHEVLVDRSAWQDVLWKAIRSSGSVRTKASLKLLLKHEFVPSRRLRFVRYVMKELGLEAEEAEEVWSAVKASKAGWRGWVHAIDTALSQAGGRREWREVGPHLAREYMRSHAKRDNVDEALSMARKNVPASYWSRDKKFVRTPALAQEDEEVERRITQSKEGSRSRSRSRGRSRRAASSLSVIKKSHGLRHRIFWLGKSFPRMVLARKRRGGRGQGNKY